MSIKITREDEREKYGRIQEKMQANMMMAIERVGELSKSYQYNLKKRKTKFHDLLTLLFKITFRLESTL